MGRESWILVAFGVLAGAALVVSVCGWVLFVRDRRLRRDEPSPEPTEP